MKSGLLFACFTLVFVALASATGSATTNDALDESDVVFLNEENFDTITAEGTWLIEFFAPWCGHCKNLKPVWAQLATQSKGKFNVGAVDCSVHSGLAKRFGIRGLPTIKLIHAGKLYEYGLKRTIEDFTSFAEGGYASTEAKEIPPAVPAATAAPVAAEKEVAPTEADVVEEGGKQVVVLTTDNFDELTKTGTWLVEFYAPWCGHCKKLTSTWDQLGKQADEGLSVGKVDCTAHQGVCSRFGVRGYPTIKMLHNGDPRDYSGARTVDAFLGFYRKFLGKDEL